jgi:hypothetical protein
MFHLHHNLQHVNESEKVSRSTMRCSLHWPAHICVHNLQKLWSPRCSVLGKWSSLMFACRNPTLAKCGGEAQHLEKLEVGSLPGLPNVQSSTARGKIPRLEVFLVSLERSWNVDIENALALAIRTSAAQVMGKRRAGSQTGSLTPDH